MWILHICHSYYPPFLDCARQYNALFKNTPYKVLTVYLTGDEDKEVVLATQSDEVVFLGYKSKDVSGLKLGAIAKIKGIIKKKKFLICIAHRVKPTYVALLATDLPVVSVHHNYNDYQRWSRRILVNFYRSRILMLGVSDSVRDDLRRDLVTWPIDQIQTLYNHIDVGEIITQMVSSDEAREHLKLPPSAYIIGNVGRLHRDKDQATLIKGFAKALPKLPKNSLLVIIGEGLLGDSLIQLAESLNVSAQVKLIGKVLNAKQYFKAFDVFALTSDHEPFGMVLLEAMAAGLPIICSDCGGGREVVKNTGYLFPLGDADALASAMLDVYQNHSFGTDASVDLNAKFSDEAVKEQFWSLSFIHHHIRT